MKAFLGSLTVGMIFVYITVFILWAYGYIQNIIKLISHIDTFGILELARCIGVVAGPLGAVLGFVG